MSTKNIECSICGESHNWEISDAFRGYDASELILDETHDNRNSSQPPCVEGKSEDRYVQLDLA